MHMTIDLTTAILNASDTIVGDADGNAIAATSQATFIDALAGDDVVTGGAGDDAISAGTGNDTVLASSGNDVYIGGTGFDTLDFSNANSGLNIDISKGTAIGTGSTTSFDSFERVVGSSFADIIKGSDQVDVIDGGAGNDLIRSKAGADILTGGEGHDTYQFMKKDVMLNGVHQGVDTITDFSGSDTIDLHDFFKGRVTDINDAIHLTDTADGTLVSAKLDGAYVNVALLQGQHIPAETTVQALASDGLFIV